MSIGDYQGIATLIAALAAAVISILGAIQTFRVHSKVEQVDLKMNGLQHAQIDVAGRMGRTEGELQTLTAVAQASGLMPRPPEPNPESHLR
jgi:hypothetical protein